MADDTAPASKASEPLDQDQLPLEELARAVLERRFRPRVTTVRRLAEGVLARAAKAKKKGGKKAAAASGKGGKKKKKRKLATIPGQKGSKA